MSNPLSHPKEELDEEVFQTYNVNDDFDQLNEEKITYNKYVHTNQQSQNVDQEPVTKQNSMKVFGQESAVSMQNKFTLQKSRQTQIGNRLIQIRLEMKRLQKQLNQNVVHQQEMQQQANQAYEKVKGSNEPGQAEFNLKRAKQQLTMAKDQMDQCAFLKQKLIKLYKMQGFKNMVKSNPNMSEFLGIIQQDFIRDGDEENMISAQITGRSVNMMEFSRMIEKLRFAHIQKKEEKEKWNESPQVNINIMYDKSQKDIGVLIKLNHLMKRLELINYLVGDWKPTTKKYNTITEQVKYIHRKLELLNESKIMYFQKRADVLKQEVEDLRQQSHSDPSSDKLQQRQNQMGHDKKTIDSLFTNAKSVKQIADQIPQIVERLEQKQKVHDMAAQILLSIERMEQQQDNILKSAAKENKQVLEALQKGMKENTEVMKQNVEMLKIKIGAKIN